MKAKQSAPTRRFNAVVSQAVKARNKLASAQRAYHMAMEALRGFKA